MTLLGKRVTIGRDALTISVLDDERAKTEVQRFKGMVERNLQTLRAEYERNKPQLEQTIQQAAAQRKAQIDGLQVRDALKREWANGVDTHHKEGVGAARFSSGKGRHGDFADIA